MAIFLLVAMKVGSFPFQHSSLACKHGVIVAISCKILSKKYSPGCTKARHFKWKIQKISEGGWPHPSGAPHPIPPSMPSASQSWRRRCRTLATFLGHTLLDTFCRLLVPMTEVIYHHVALEFLLHVSACQQTLWISDGTMPWLISDHGKIPLLFPQSRCLCLSRHYSKHCELMTNMQAVRFTSKRQTYHFNGGRVEQLVCYWLGHVWYQSAGVQTFSIGKTSTLQQASLVTFVHCGNRCKTDRILLSPRVVNLSATHYCWLIRLLICRIYHFYRGRKWPSGQHRSEVRRGHEFKSQWHQN